MATVREKRTASQGTLPGSPRTARKKKRLLQNAPEELKGLCITCNNAPACSFRRQPDQPVVYCDEFDSASTLTVEEPHDEVAPTAAQLEEWDMYKGLCVNCENRKDCAIRDREIGVWHCEEYV